MDVHPTLEEVARWCAKQTVAGDPESVEVDCHGMVCITIGESPPPWHVRWKRRSSAVPVLRSRSCVMTSRGGRLEARELRALDEALALIFGL